MHDSSSTGTVFSQPSTVLHGVAVLPILLAALLCACNGKAGPGADRVAAAITGPQVNPRHSGYAGTVGDWKRFLGCWRDGFHVPPDSVLASALQGSIRPDSGNDAGALAELDAAEKRLGVKLPRSYRDFILAYSAAERPASATLDHYTGLLPPSQIGYLRDLQPSFVHMAAERPWESLDADYLVYGTDQDDATVRQRYVAKAIVVGKFGDAMYENIVLRPQLLTQDGEMEAAIGYHAGQFRAPSFAELMRQLSYSELGNADHSPGYAQTVLRGSCAERLPMREVWWR